MSDSTRGLWLTARLREGSFEGEACLLVYDEYPFDDVLVSRDIKTVFERRASTAHIFIAAPNTPTPEALASLTAGSAFRRAMPYLAGLSGTFSFISLDPAHRSLQYGNFKQANDKVIVEAPALLPDELVHGWLFDLFHKSDGLVEAPAGVHFQKGSTKHSDKFLRTANVLTTSAACAWIALLCLTRVKVQHPRQILVDTSPLISLAYALQRVAVVHKIWTEQVPVKSFKSYGGLDHLGKISSSDVVLISATTSGSLVQRLEARGAKPHAIATIYFLSDEGAKATPPDVLCNLTAKVGRAFGYQRLRNYPATDCKLCESGSMAVELEGDQFLLQKRQTASLRVVKLSQPASAREALEHLTRTRVLAINLRPGTGARTLLQIDGDQLLSNPWVRERMLRNLRRFCPQPVKLVVRVGVSPAAIDDLFRDAGHATLTAQGAVCIDHTELGSQHVIPTGGALVVFGALMEHSTARSINASLRGLVASGIVTYISGVAISESPMAAQDLGRFLQFGEHGPDTFTFRPSAQLAFPGPRRSSAWEQELRFLTELGASAELDPMLGKRSDWLGTNTHATAELFWPGQTSELKIQPDFVLLDTNDRPDEISQADVFVVVANALAAARCKNKDLDYKIPLGELPQLSQTVYGQYLLSPSNFQTFNDAILKAAFLRAADQSELCFFIDEDASEEMLNIVLAEIQGWTRGAGDALPEILISIASRRLRLTETHAANVRRQALSANLPPHLIQLATAIHPGHSLA